MLFDCLEEAFKGTDNATLIDDLYQGEMVDYLTTIGYEYESRKPEKFLVRVCLSVCPGQRAPHLHKKQQPHHPLDRSSPHKSPFSSATITS